MEISYLAQPTASVGQTIDEILSERGHPLEFVIVSAFASLPTVFRFKPRVLEIKAAGSDVRMVLGVDMGGTSKEVLTEVASWPIPVTVVKNRARGMTFHPKIYFLRWKDRADIIVGSNNLTDGGLYKNYEASSRSVYDLPTDEALLQQALSQLARFVVPSGDTARVLTEDYLEQLLGLAEIPSEAEARHRRGEAPQSRSSEGERLAAFGYEPVNYPPRLPTELQQLLLRSWQAQHSEYKSALSKAKRQASAKLPTNSEPLPIPAPPEPLAQMDPVAFYMNLPAMKGDNNSIPGEARVPLEALETARSFWGWPENYVTTVSPRKGDEAKEPRIYRNWKPFWRISVADATEAPVVSLVRMYFYQNSSDFRLYCGELVRLKATSDDIIRLQRIDEVIGNGEEGDVIAYECTLAKKGSARHAEWTTYLVNGVSGSTRRYGFG